MNLKKISLVIVSFVFIALSFFSISKSLNAIYKIDPYNKNHFEIAGNSLKVEVVTSEKAKEKGLSGRKSIEDKEGMLFISQEKGDNKIWMKDMNFPIDIIWFDENMKVIFLKENVSPQSFPQTFGPNQNSKYVLEVKAGFCKKNNLKIGDFAFFLP